MGLTGAILGDIAGSRFEFQNQIPNWETCELFHRDCMFTDDTVQNISVGLAIVWGKNFTELLHGLCNKYLFVGYGGNFHKWLSSPPTETGKSWANGASMRVSAIAELASSLNALKAFFPLRA